MIDGVAIAFERSVTIAPTISSNFSNERQKCVLGTEILSIGTHVRVQKLVNVKTYVPVPLSFFEIPARARTGV